MLASPVTPVGALAAQMNSYLRSLVTTVVSCEPSPKNDGTFNIVCADSVLFPEGGGQPADRGTLNGDVAVLNVQRVKDLCVLTADKALEPGTEVKMEVDWLRRVDHMQHHSAQHLLTAVVEEHLKLPTTSWSLTHPFCFICLPTAKVEQADVEKVEGICNELITKATKVERRTYESRAEVPPARSRSIPEDFSGPIRLIDIDSVDTCACCGTHVNTLAELQMLKILHQEAKGNTCKLFFITGARLSSYFSEMFGREKALTKELGCATGQIVANVTRRGQDSNDFQKRSKKLLAEVATLVAPAIAAQLEASSDKVFTFLREDGDMDFLTTIAAHLAKSHPARIVLLAAGATNKENEGQLMLFGPDAAQLQKVVDALQVELDAKGALAKQGFRGKANLKKWKAFVKKLPTMSFD